MTHTIQQRIAAWAGFCLLTAIVLIIAAGFWQFESTNNEQLSHTKRATTELALNYLQASAEKQSLTFNKRLNEAFYTAEGLASTFSAIRENKSLKERRSMMVIMLQKLLEGRSDFIGVYIGLEPNALEGDDSAYKGLVGADADGRFLPYVIHTDEGIKIDTLVDMENQTRNELGQRAGEYYLCSKDTKASCLVDPYLYPINGKDVLLTSLVTPILDNGKFIGIAGVDLTMDFIQKLVQQTNPHIFDGKGKMIVVSHLGVVAGHSNNTQAIGQSIAKIDPNGKEILTLLRDQKTTVLQEGNDFQIVVPFTVGTTTKPWAVYVRLPKAVALADVQAQDVIATNAQDSFKAKSLIVGIVVAMIAMGVMWFVSYGISRPIKNMAALVRDIAEGEGDLTRRLQVERQDELGELATEFNKFTGGQRDLVRRMVDTGKRIDQLSEQGSQTASTTGELVAKQQEAIEQIVTAVTEMASASSEVAKNAEHAAVSVRSVDASAIQGQNTVNETAQSVGRLEKQILGAKEVIESLEANSGQIISILSVIQGIAEQTNLLALNAAIEAARAGDAGRGFAVVADEVRALAGRTRGATEDIRTMIDKLQSSSKEAAAVMETSALSVRETADKAQHATAALAHIRETIESIYHMNAQIATATEEQSLVTEDVNRNIAQVSEFAATSSSESIRLTKATDELKQAARDLLKQSSKFKV